MNTNKEFLKTLVNKTVEGATSEKMEDLSNLPLLGDNADFDLQIVKSRKREQIAINLKPELVIKLENLSRKNGCSRSKVIETLLEKILKT